MSLERVAELEREVAGLTKKHADALTRENELKAQVTKLSGDLEFNLIDQQAERVALSKGAAVSALEDIKARVKRDFKTIDGRAIAHTPNGDVRHGKNGTPMEMEEYFAVMRDSAPHLFNQRISTSKTGNIIISAEDAHDPRKYRLAKEEARLAGVSLDIVENAPSRESTPGRFTLTREQAQDPRQYRAMKAEAAKVGQSVEILSE